MSKISSQEKKDLILEVKDLAVHYDTDDGLVIEIVEEDAPLTFNEWYGTELHELPLH